MPQDLGRTDRSESIHSDGSQPVAPADAEHAQAGRLGDRGQADSLGDDGVAGRVRVALEGIPRGSDKRVFDLMSHKRRVGVDATWETPNTAARPSITSSSSETVKKANRARREE